MTNIVDALAGTGMVSAASASALAPTAAELEKLKESEAKKKVSSQSATDIVKQGEEETKPLIDKLKTDEKGAPVLPTVENGMLKAEPKKDPPNPMQGYVSMLGVLGALGSMFTRHPLTATMNGAAAALQAMKQGDAEDFKNKRDTWKIQNDNAFKMLDYQQNIYKSIIENDHWNIDEKRSQTLAQASALKDDVTIQHMKTGDWDSHLRLVSDLDKAKKEGEKYSAEVEKIGYENQATLQIVSDAKGDVEAARQKIAEAQQAFNAGKMSPKDFAAAKEEFKNAQQTFTQTMREVAKIAKAGAGGAGGNVTISEEVIKQKAESLFHGASYLDVGLSMRSGNNPDRDAVDDYLAKNHPDFDRAKAIAGQSGLKSNLAAQGRREGTTVQAVQELDALAQSTRESLHKLQKSNKLGLYPDINKLKNSVAYRSGDPDIVEAINNVQEFKNAYTAVLIRGGQRSDEAQRLSDKLIDEAFAKKQADRAIDTMLANSKRIEKGLEKAKNQTLGENTTQEDPNRELTPEELEEYKKLSGGK